MMVFKQYPTLLIAFAISVTSCSTFEGYPRQTSLPPHLTLEAIDKDLDTFVTRYENASSEDRKRIRNDLLRRYMIVTDIAYEGFERDIYVQNLRGTVYTDWTTNLLNSASPATDHIPTRNVLSGLSTVLSGGKTIYESNVLAKGIMPALIAEMRTSREIVRHRIRTRSALPSEQYDLYDALNDLNEYKVAGTIPKAVSTLNTRAAEEHAAITARTDNSNNFNGLDAGTTYAYSETPPPPADSFTPTTGMEDRAIPPANQPEESTSVTTTTRQPTFSSPPRNNTISPTNLKGTSATLQNWLDSDGVKNIPLLMGWLKADSARPNTSNDLIYRPQNEEFRKQAINDLIK